MEGDRGGVTQTLSHYHQNRNELESGDGHQEPSDIGGGGRSGLALHQFGHSVDHGGGRIQ